jgi:hypothetical protein
MHRLSGGQAVGEKWAMRGEAGIKTVDDADGSQENSKSARMASFRNSGIPRGQENLFSWVQLSVVQWV